MEETHKLKLVHLAPYYLDAWAYKDGVQLLYAIQKERSFDSLIVTFNNDNNYSVTRRFTNVKIIKKSWPYKYINTIKILFYLASNAKDVDILFQFHISWHTLLFSFFYKKFNKNGLNYLKMDNSINARAQYEWFDYFTPNPNLLSIKSLKKYLIGNYFINSVDLFSIEDEETLIYLRDKFNFIKNKIILIPNGLDLDQTKNINVKTFSEKENIILTAGRIGDYEKNTDILLEAILSVGYDNLQNWKIILAGGINKDFQFKIDDFYRKDKRFKENVFFVGHKNRDELFELYNKAKIFCLPSKWEGFANVFSEAMYFSNAIITTEKVAPKNIIKDRCGIIIKPDNQNELAEAITFLTANDKKCAEFGHEAYVYAIEHLDWNKIVMKIIHAVNKLNINK